jgi:hypothetical protein
MNAIVKSGFKVAAACCVLWGAAGVQAQPIAYPGSTWGQLSYPAGLSREEKDNTLLAGRIEQGADWFRFGEDRWKFNTYVALAYTVDNRGLPYNNKLTPAVGMKVTRTFDSGVLDLGVQAIHEKRWRDDLNGKSSGVQAYASWWFGWDARKMMGPN